MIGFGRVLLLVMDSVGVGALPDAVEYGDEGSNTLGNLARAVGGLSLTNLGALGLGNIVEIVDTSPNDKPGAFWGRAAIVSRGRDTTTGHWEMAGLRIDKPFSLFSNGFPDHIVDKFTALTGFRVLGNKAASGTKIIEELGDEHVRTGKLILYTSADSVFQLAAHESVVPLEILYDVCRKARTIMDRHRVGRVIARPFVGSSGNYTRTYNRKDFSMEPIGTTVLDILCEHGIPVVGVGKIRSVFGGRSVPASYHTAGNTDGIRKTIAALRQHPTGLIFVNLGDFDTLYGHRNNPKGYAEALLEFDGALPAILEAAGNDTLVILTADHGCDPTTSSTDHSREYVPLLVTYSGIGTGKELGTRQTLADVGQTVLEALTGAPGLVHGTSFLNEIKRERVSDAAI